MRRDGRGTGYGHVPTDDEASSAREQHRADAYLRGRFAQFTQLVAPRPALHDVITRGGEMRQRKAATSSSLGQTISVAFAAVIVLGALIVVQTVTHGMGQVPAARPSASLMASTLPTSSAATAATVRVTKLATGATVGAVWSPDGSSIALRVEEPGIAAVEHLFDNAGTETRSLTADMVLWRGGNSFIVLRKGASGAIQASGGRVDTAAETTVTTLVPIAPDPDHPCIASNTGSAYTLVLNGVESGWRPGVVLACSADGREVAVMRITGEQDTASTGVVQIVDATTGATVTEYGSVPTYQLARAVFSKDGKTVAFSDTTNSIWIASVSATSATKVLTLTARDAVVLPDFLPDGRLAVPDPARRQIRAFDANGKESPTALPYGRTVSASAAGIVLTYDPRATFINVTMPDGAVSRLDVPDGGAMPGPIWAPGGKSAVLLAVGATSQTKASFVPEYASLVSFR